MNATHGHGAERLLGYSGVTENMPGEEFDLEKYVYLRERIRAVGTGPLFFTGYPLSGKTTALAHMLKGHKRTELKKGELEKVLGNLGNGGGAILALPNEMEHGFAKELLPFFAKLRDRRDLIIVEGRHNVFNAIFNSEDIYHSKMGDDSKGVMVRIKMYIKNGFNRQKGAQLFEDQSHVDFYFDKKDADELLSRLGVNDGATREKIKRYAGINIGGTRIYLPALMRSAAQNPQLLDNENLLQKLERSDEIFGLEAISVGVIAASAIDKLGDTIGNMITSLFNGKFASILGTLVPYGALAVGIFALVESEKGNDPMKVMLERAEAWDLYPNETREVIASSYDVKLGLEPGTSLRAFNKMFGNSRALTDALNEINDQIKSLREHIEALKSASRWDLSGDAARRDYYRITLHELATLKREMRLVQADGGADAQGENIGFEGVVRLLSGWGDTVPRWRLLAIVGPPGVGKSHFAYQLVGRVAPAQMHDDKPENGRFKKAAGISRAEDYLPKEEGTIFVADDKRVASSDALIRLLEAVATAREDSIRAPLVISINESAWHVILRGVAARMADQDYRDNLINKTLVLRLGKLTNEQMREVLGKQLDKYGVRHKDDASLDGLVRKANGIPVIMEMFLSVFSHKAAARKSGKPIEFEEKDLEDVIKYPVPYAISQIYSLYLRPQGPDVGGPATDNAILTLSLLKRLAAYNGVPIGHLYLPVMRGLIQWKNAIGSSAAFAEAWRAMSLPFFNISKVGIVTPIHGSVGEAIEAMIGGYASSFGDLDDDEDARRLIDGGAKQFVEEAGRQGIKGDVNESMKRLSEEETGILDAYRNRLAGMGQLSEENVTLCFCYLSLFMGQGNERIPDKAILSRISELKDADGILQAQTQDILSRFSYSELTAFRSYFVKLLSSGDEYVRSRAWDSVNNLIGRKVITTGDASANKDHFIELLKSGDEDVRSRAWYSVNNLIGRKVITIGDASANKGHFIELLKSGDEYVRSRSWRSVNNLIDRKVITSGDASANKGHFIELLKSGDEDVRSRSWDSAKDLIDCGVITAWEICEAATEALSNEGSTESEKEVCRELIKKYCS